MEVRTRFAPSPTGYLHIGGLRTALYAYLYARKFDGKFILRIEDTDQERQVEGAEDVIYNTLKLTGLTYDEGPDVGGEYGPYIQSQRKEIYYLYARELVKRGAAYYCFCTKERLQQLREEKEAKGEAYAYDKHCLSLSPEEVQKRIDAGEPYVIRQNIPREGSTTYTDLVYGEITVPNSDLDDNVLLKSDGMPTYNLANVIDDHLMHITHIIRGVEYLSSTPKYNLLYEAMGWPLPVYIHLPPVMRDKQQKLSKRHGDASFKDFTDKGYLKEAILNYIALLGWSPGSEREIFTLEELADAFSLEGLSKSPAIFDTEKLTWMNAQYIRALPPAEFLRQAMPYYASCLPHGRFDLVLLSRILQPRLETMTQIYDKLDFLLTLPAFDLALYEHKKMKTTQESSLPMLLKAREFLNGLSDYSETSLHEGLMGLVETLGVKNGFLLWPLRIAVTGTLVTPGGAVEIICLLGKEETLKRLDKSIETLKKTLNA
jgi:glutamyl-tRNA synthetase